MQSYAETPDGFSVAFYPYVAAPEAAREESAEQRRQREADEFRRDLFAAVGGPPDEEAPS